MEAFKACAQSVYDSSEFEPLRAHIPLEGSYSLEQLTDSHMATDEQIKAIYAEHPKMAACREQALNSLAQFTPTVVPILTSEWIRAEDSLIRLIEKKQTWGEYSTAIRADANESRSQLIAEGQRIGAELARSHEVELARRQAAAAAIVQFAQTQQVINAMTRPVTTTCSAYANSSTCVTH